MKIFVLSRKEITKEYFRDKNFINRNYIISIYSSMFCVSENESKSPFPDHLNVLKLNFDDVTERDAYPEDLKNKFLFFTKEHAQKIHKFIETIKDDGSKDFYVHCDAGVSRSGAVGYMLNEWFNKYLENNRCDNIFFQEENRHIMPNPLVIRLLKQELFGNDYRGVFVNDYTYNEDGDKIDNISEI